MTAARARRLGALLAGLVVLAYLAWLAAKIMAKVPAEVGRLAGAILHGTPLTPNPPLHDAGSALLTVAVIVAWSVLALADRIPGRGMLATGLVRLGLGGALSPAAVLLALAGLAMLVAVVLVQLAPGLPAPLAIAALAVLGLTASVVVAAGRHGVAAAAAATPASAEPPTSIMAHSQAPDPASPERARALRLLRRGATVATAVALALLLFSLVEDIVHLAVFRPEAFGDEAYFWWRASITLHDVGLGPYVSGFAVAGYSPGYPLLGDLLLGWIGDPWFEAAFRAFPFMLGITVVGMLLRGHMTRARLLSPGAGVFYLVVFLVIAKQSWVHRMFFQLWYGETIAIAIFGLILLVLDHARRTRFDDLRVLVLLGVGLGAFAALSKPPITVLLVPAVLPTIVLTSLLLRRGGPVRPLLVAAGAVAAGAVAAQVAWGSLLAAAGRSPYYAIDVQSLLDLHPGGAVTSMAAYFVTNYDAVWVAFVVVSVVALVADWRRFLPGWLAALGMIASVFVLYLGPWSTVEFESGSRYILHGAIGWLAFALPALGPTIQRAVTAGLDRIAARLATWRPGQREGAS